jgi:FlaA1/EpsC-like NDP-sugar epimerase
MSIPEAAELVIQAGAMGVGGDVFVLDMGESVRIIDLAKRLINLSGFEVKDENHLNGDIEIVFTGLRPGEKLYEELLIGDNVSKTDHQQILRAEEEFIAKKEIERLIDELNEAEKSNDVNALKEIFRQVIHGYESDDDIVDVVSLHNTETK